VLSIREYGKTKNVSYEAIRKQIIRYDKELAGKILTRGRTKYLTDEAIQFLDAHRAINPIIEFKEREKSEHEEQKNELADLRDKYTALLEQLAMMQKEHAQERIALTDKIEALYQKQIELLEANTGKRKKWFWQK
jgi:hypothetical protein